MQPDLSWTHSLSLIQATEEQKRMRDLATYPAWGIGLSLEHYMIRERQIRDQNWAQTRQKTWILMDEQKTFLSSCETFEMETLRQTANERKGSSPAFQNKTCLGIASVFTEEKYRGHGYSTLLLKKLIAHVQQTAPEVESFVLYSEVGTPLYEKLGFRPVESDEWVFSTTESSHGAGDTVVILTQDHQNQIQALLESVASLPVLDDSWMIRPTLDQLNWHWQRQNVDAQLLQLAIPQTVGAMKNDSFILWTSEYRKDLMWILDFSAKTGKDAVTLLHMARDFARSLSLSKVKMWANEDDSDFSLQPSLQSFTSRQFRNSSIAMVLPLEEELKLLHWRKRTRAIWV